MSHPIPGHDYEDDTEYAGVQDLAELSYGPTGPYINEQEDMCLNTTENGTSETENDYETRG